MNEFLIFISKHWILCSAFVAAFVLFIILEMRAVKRGPSKISAHQATLLINREDALVIDIRETAAYDKGHITGAKHIPRSQIENHISSLEKKKTKPIILVCEMGSQATMIGSLLKRKGFIHVYSLSGGINAWLNAGLPLQKK